VNEPVGYPELAELMNSRAGLAVDAAQLADRPDAAFTDFDLDSLGLLGIVAELEKRHGVKLGENAEGCRTPRAFLAAVNAALSTAV
jgi:minimal PKS acyl carrier protein